MSEKITLVGGGLAGGLLGVYLARRGYKVKIFERRSDMRSGNYEGGRSINLALSTRGIRALEKVGLDKEILSIAIPMTGRMIHDVEGRLAYQPYGKDGQAIHSVSRGGLNIRLLQLADQYENIELFFDHRCVHADPDTGLTRYINANGDEIEDTADVVIGTDGAFSAVRDSMMRYPRFNYSQTYENHGYKELEITPGDSGEFRINKNCLHIWPRKSFMMIALPNPGGNFTCTLFMPFVGQPGFENLQTPQEILELFEKEFPDALPMMPGLSEDFFGNPTGALATIRCYPWVKGKTALLGDSAHAVVPFYGQGMNCSFEDCIILDELIDTCEGDWIKILDEYQKSRKPNADAIADLAVQNFVEMRDLVGTDAFLHRKHIEHDLTELYPDLFHSQYELVTFSTNPYSYAKVQGSKNDNLLDHIIEHKLESRITEKTFMENLIKEKLA
ncbi:MAG: FAD-dependent monooxygenase [Bacteroidetes bacterium]|nr:FAD-dependent monooxygenase [Bacteroidota bacterium]